MTVTRNRMQIIDLIVCDDTTSHNEDVSRHKVVLTGSHPVSEKINTGVIIIKRQSMNTRQEETDTMIIHQVAEVKTTRKCRRVVVDDTDIFVRLLHLCCQGGIPTSTCLDGFANS